MRNLIKLPQNADSKQQKRQIILDLIKDTQRKNVPSNTKDLGRFRSKGSSIINKRIPKEMFQDLSKNLKSIELFTLQQPNAKTHPDAAALFIALFIHNLTNLY